MKKKNRHSPSKTALSAEKDSSEDEEEVEQQQQTSSKTKCLWFLRKESRRGEKYEKSGSSSPLATRHRSGSGRRHPPITPPKTKKAPSRFSLRRLFYSNPLLAQPFLQSPLATPAPSASASRRKTPHRSIDDAQSDTRSVWRDNLSACSSVQGASSVAGPSSATVRTCPLCLGDCTLDQFPLLRNCPHLFCIVCLQVYVKIEIQEGRVNLKCPQCPEVMHPNDIETLIGEKNSHLLTLYETLMLRRILATDPDTRWCPGPNCNYAVIAAGCASCPKIECDRPGCGYSFCYHCKAEWHPNQTCDAARAERHHSQTGLRSSSATFSLESAAAAALGGGGTSNLVASGSGGGGGSEVKVCPRCNMLIVKMEDGSCNHMTCAVCGAEFCWLCMKEISDLHYLSPSGCTFWGKKPWSRKKKLLWQLGTLVGAPVGIALLAGISVPAMIIGIPSWVGRKIHDHYKGANKHKRNVAVVGGVVSSVVLSPFLAVLAVSIGVPILLCYVYGVVPIALCRSEGCGVSTSGTGVRIDIDEEEPPYRPAVSEAVLGGGAANPSIGEVSLGASMSLGSGCHLDGNRDDASGSREPDRESASNTAVAGASLTGSVASSYLGPSGHHSYSALRAHNRLEVGADVHTRKKFSFSSERLSETVSLSERSATVSLADDGGGSAAASTRALAGSLLAYKLGDSQSVNSYRTGEASDGTAIAKGDDEVSLRSLPLSSLHSHHMSSLSGGGGGGVGGHQSTSLSQQHHHHSSSGMPPRSLSPVSSMSGDELSLGVSGRRSQRRRPLLDKQLSENSSLLSAEDTVSERVRFDDNVSFIDDCMPVQDDPPSLSAADSNSSLGRVLKPNKMEAGIVPEETAEELAQVISPEPHPRREFVLNKSSEGDENNVIIDGAGSSIVSQGGNVTLLSVGEGNNSRMEETITERL